MTICLFLILLLWSFKGPAKVNFQHSAGNDVMVLNTFVISWYNILTERNKIKIETSLFSKFQVNV